MKWFVLRFLLTIVLIAAPTVGETGEPMRELARSTYGGITTPRNALIKDLAAWQAIWSEAVSPMFPKPPVPVVDFETEMVVAVAMGQLSTGGFWTQITNVEAANSTLRITVVDRYPEPGENVTLALTHPYHFVAVPRSELTPVFIHMPFLPVTIFKQPEGLQLSWRNLGWGYVYTLECSESLSEANWIPVSGVRWPVPSTGITLPMSASRCFYRIRAEVGPIGFGW